MPRSGINHIDYERHAAKNLRHPDCNEAPIVEGVVRLPVGGGTAWGAFSGESEPSPLRPVSRHSCRECE